MLKMSAEMAMPIDGKQKIDLKHVTRGASPSIWVLVMKDQCGRAWLFQMPHRTHRRRKKRAALQHVRKNF